VKRFQPKPIIAASLAAILACGTITIVNAETPKTPADVAAAPAGAEKTASGLASKVLTKGTGTAHPGERDEVSVHYSGWTLDGKMFDSSVQRGSPTSFPLNGVIKGWTEGLQLMVEGEKRRFFRCRTSRNQKSSRGTKNSRRCEQSPRRCRNISHRPCFQSDHQGNRQTKNSANGPCHHALFRMVLRWKNPRQLQAKWSSNHRIPRQTSNPRMERRRSTHGRRGNPPPLDS